MQLSIEVYNKGSKLSQYSDKSHETYSGNRPIINNPEILSIIDNAIERNNSISTINSDSDFIHKKDRLQ